MRAAHLPIAACMSSRRSHIPYRSRWSLALRIVGALCIALLAAAWLRPQSFAHVYKNSICALDMRASRHALELIRVTPESIAVRDRRRRYYPHRYPRVLCYVHTISVNSKRAQAIADTWGQRCDKLLFFSNVTDTIYVGKGTTREKAFDVVYMDVIADHDHLWQKNKAILRYVYAHFRHDYDWFYKADDDTYVIVENLRAYLTRPEIVMNYKRQPMQLGHRFNLTADMVDYYITDLKLKREWNQRFDRWVFNSGGPGYAMNRLYLDKFVSSIDDKSCLSGPSGETLPEDVSIAYCMMWHAVLPWDTRDTRGRERWHAVTPYSVYHRSLSDPDDWYLQYHEGIGGVKNGADCCAPDSVAFHYVAPRIIYHIERVLYFCRAEPDVLDIVRFNDEFGLAIGNKVMTYEFS